MDITNVRMIVHKIVGMPGEAFIVHFQLIRRILEKGYRRH
jgi:hypothetical protein